MRTPRLFRWDNNAVSPIIGEVLMVSIAVMLAAILYIMVSGMFGDAEEEMITVNISDPVIAQQSRGSSPTICWDATLTINKVVPKDELLVWLETKVLVKSDNGSLLHSKTNLTEDNPATYDNDDSDGITPQFWYLETISGDTKVGTGDAIKITGLDTSWGAATIVLMRGGEMLASIDLPSHFE
jgi:FlaG/FlaF family flagellin (archaellin)